MDVIGASVRAPRQINSMYVQTVRRYIYNTRRPEHPHLPIRRYERRPQGPCFTALLQVVNWKNTDSKISQDENTSVSPPGLTTPALIGGGPYVSPNRTGSQEIGSPSGSIGPVEVRNAQPLHTSINGIYAKHRYPEPNLIKVIFRKLSDKSIANIYL